jgi:hypothetical protein
VSEINMIEIRPVNVPADDSGLEGLACLRYSSVLFLLTPDN